MQTSWRTSIPFEAIVFDCDSTLSAIEGITVLAELNGVYQAVHELTEQAMSSVGVSHSLYKQRLDLVRPRLQQMQAVAHAYWQHLTLDTAEVIRCLHRLGKSVYVSSAGLLPPVIAFAAQLNIPAEHVYAVPVYFDEKGDYVSFDPNSWLVEQNGKSKVVAELREKHQTIVHIGDGMNDVEAAKVVDRFVGYGGACFRQTIADLSDFYITSASMSPLLPLLLTEKEVLGLDDTSQAVFAKGYELLQQNKVLFR
jgi:phosphoserine phosphatase